MMVPDERLIALSCDGDRRAAEQLFRRYQECILSYLIRMIGDRTLAEDAAQETFLKGFRALPRYREQGGFKQWLFQIAHREGLRLLKKERRRLASISQRTPNEEQDDIVDPSPLPPDILMRRERIRRIEQALDLLTDPEKQVVLLRLEEELSFKAIAKIMGCPLNTVLGRMHNAVKKLQLALHQEG